MTAADTARRMDRMYGLQRHIYDLTRRYYLLGRDRLITDLAAGPGETFCEMGCGTARNLVQAARRYPDAHWLGVDPSPAMLTTARRSVERAGVGQRVTLARGEAAAYVPPSGPGSLDGLLLSFVLSMVPDWPAAVDHGLALLRPGGSLHIADFGDQAGLPRWSRRALRGWLDRFGVHPRDALPAHMHALAAAGHGRAEVTPVYRGYTVLIRFDKA